MRRVINLLVSITIVIFGSSNIEASNSNHNLLLSDSAFIGQARNTITGFVFGGSRTPLTDVHVELLSDVGSTVARTKTTGSGVYSFRGLRDGIYSVKVLPYGIDFLGEERRISLVSISARPGSGSISEQVDFYLRPNVVNSGPLAAPGVVFVQEIPKNAKKLYLDGIEFLRDKKENEGFGKLKLAIETFPNYFAALDRLGTEYVVRGHDRIAHVLLTKAVEINPRSFSSTFGLGLAQFRLKQIKEALVNLKHSTELYRESINAHMWLGIAYYNSGRLPEAVSALNQANKLSKGKSADVHWHLAKVYKEQGRFAEAANELEALLKYKPDTPNAAEIKQTIVKLRQKAGAS